MKTTKKSKLNENALRSMLRKEIIKLLEAEEEQEAPEQEAPEQEEEPEQEIDPELEAITKLYIRKLKDSGVGVGAEELTHMLSTVIEHFVHSSEEKLNILKAIKTNIIH